MEAKRLVQLRHDARRLPPDPRPESLHRHRAHLLRLGIVAQAGGDSRQEQLERVDPLDARGHRDN